MLRVKKLRFEIFRREASLLAFCYATLSLVAAFHYFCSKKLSEAKSAHAKLRVKSLILRYLSRSFASLRLYNELKVENSLIALPAGVKVQKDFLYKNELSSRLN